MNKISNINIVTDAPNDSTSFYRAHGVFNQLRKKSDINISLFDDKQFGWNTVGKYDILYLHRPNNNQHLEIAAIAKKNGVPLWIDFDDDIMNIPQTNPAYRAFSGSKQIIKDIVNMADYVSTSTRALKDNMVSACQADATKFTVLPNFVPLDNLRFNAPRKRAKFRILWRGSATHEADWATCLPYFVEFLKKYGKDCEFINIGDMPLMAKLEIAKYTQVTTHAGRRLIDYLLLLSTGELGDFIFVPLEDNAFNHAKCLTSDTFLSTKEGIKYINEVNVGDTVYQNGEWGVVTDKFTYEKRKTLKIITKRGYEIEGTCNHRLSLNGEWVELSKLKIGNKLDFGTVDFPVRDYVKIPISPYCHSSKKKKNKEITFDSDMLPVLTINERWGRLIGYIMGDGCLYNNQSFSISCDSRYEDVVEDVLNMADSLGIHATKNIKKYKGVDGHGVDIHMNSKILVDIFRNILGNKGTRKKVLKTPPQIFNSPKSVIREYIRGVFETDGTVNSTGCSFSTKQHGLAKEIQYLLLGFGIKSSLSKGYNKKYMRTYYGVRLQRQAADIFYKEIGFISKRKNEKLRVITEKKHSNAYKEWDDKEEIVEIIESENDVYDITVDKTHYYNANGFISHNSDIACQEGLIGGMPSLAPEWLKVNKGEYESYEYHVAGAIPDALAEAFNVWDDDYEGYRKAVVNLQRRMQGVYAERYDLREKLIKKILGI